MLVAYLDELGHIGPYISPSHKKYKSHPIFGYGGFIIPAEELRQFGSTFERVKDKYFAKEIEQSGAHPRRWEKKGAELLTERNWLNNTREVRHKLRFLASELGKAGGQFFYYGEVKPRGAEKETGESSIQRSTSILIQSIRNLSYIANAREENMMVLLDEVDTSSRDHAISNMAGFLFSKDAPPEARWIVEVPMQIESERYGAMQFADWYCALVSRSSFYKFADIDKFEWAPELFRDVSIPHGRTSRHSRIWIPDRKWNVWARDLASPDWEYFERAG